jgi:hypothetical protein
MNREKKEEKKRGKPFPSKPISREEWDDMVLGAEEPKKLSHKHLPELPKSHEDECEASKTLSRILEKLS